MYTLYQTVQSLHERFPDRVHSLEAFQAFFFAKYPDVDKDLYLSLFQTLTSLSIDTDVGVGILEQIKQRQMALKLSEEAVKFATGYIDYDKFTERVEFWKGEQNDAVTEDFEFVTDDLEVLLNETVLKPGLRWRLNCLNKSLGSLRKGNFGFLFARPETGKTSFLASESTHMLGQLDENAGPILWFNNEQPGNEVMLRVQQAYFGVTLGQLLANRAKYAERWKSEVRGKFKLRDEAAIDKGRVEKIVKQLKPSLVIFDQIDKIKGFTADREDLHLGAIYIWTRELAKTYCPVIGVCQADGTAENQMWLTMAHVSNAKTSKQAEADWILGIGKVHREGMGNIRYLNISKNKLLGDEDTDSDLRHGQFETYIEANIARYKDIVKYD